MANYIYNRVELLELPELDKAAPYAVLWKNSNGQYRLYISPSEFTANGDDEVIVSWVGIDGNKFVSFYALENDAWIFDINLSIGDTAISGVFWTNHDIYHEDGKTLYLDASDPIPVGSAPEVEPKAFMAGWRMGQFIRGMRG